MSKKRAWLFVALIILVVTAISAAPYSETWVASGDSINIDGVELDILVSGSPIRVLIRGDGFSEALEHGECFETYYSIACINESRLMDNSKTQVKIELSRKEVNINLSLSAEEELYAGEENELIYSFEIKGTEEPDSIYFETIFPEEITIEKSTKLEVEEVEAGNKVWREFEYFELGDIIEIPITISSHYPKEYSFSGELKYEYKDEEEKSYAKPVETKFLSHYEFNVSKEKFNQSNTYLMNLSLENVVDKEIEVVKSQILFPETLNIVSMEKYEASAEEENLNSQLYNVYGMSTDLKKSETEIYELRTAHYRTEEYIIPVLIEYIYNKETYFGEEYINISVEVNNSISEICVGDDFNITFRQDNASYGAIMNGNDSIEGKNYFAGMSTNFFTYIQGTVEEEMRDIKISVYANKELKIQENYDYLRIQEKKNTGKISDTLGFEDYVFEVEIEYYCVESEEWHTQNLTETISIEDIDALTIEKDMESEVEEGEEILVSVTVENDAKIYIHEVRSEEVIPEGFRTKGPITKTFSLKNEEEDEIYSYYLIAPDVDEDSNYVIATNLSFEYEGKQFNYTDEQTLKVIAKNATELEFTITGTKTPRLFEPLELKIGVENKDTIKVENLSIIVPQSLDYDLETKQLDFPILYPEQSVNLSIKLIPKVENLSIENITLKYASENDNTPKQGEYDVSLSLAKVDFPEINYTIKETKLLDGKYNYTLWLDNPSSSTAKGKIINFGEEEEFTLLAGEKIKRRLNYQEKLLDDNHQLLNKTLITYTYVGRDYELVVSNILLRREKAPVVNLTSTNGNGSNSNSNSSQGNGSKGQNNESSSQSNEIDLPKQMTPKWVYALTVVLAGIIVAGVIFSLIKLKPAKGKKTPKLSITKEEMEKVENTPIKQTEILNTSEEVNIKSKNKTEKVVEKNVEEIQPSNIFSFDDYEKLKEQLENNEKKAKK